MIEGIAGYQMDPSQVSKMQEHKSQVFEKFDVNGDGSLDSKEISTFVEDISTKTGKSIESEQIIAKMDTDDDGVVSQDEFVSARPPGHPPGMNKDVIRHARNFLASQNSSSSEELDINQDGIPDSEQTESQINSQINQYTKQSNGISFQNNGNYLNQLI